MIASLCRAGSHASCWLRRLCSQFLQLPLSGNPIGLPSPDDQPQPRHRARVRAALVGWLASASHPAAVSPLNSGLPGSPGGMRLSGLLRVELDPFVDLFPVGAVIGDCRLNEAKRYL